jgi:hypothetical protein
VTAVFGQFSAYRARTDFGEKVEFDGGLDGGSLLIRQNGIDNRCGLTSVNGLLRDCFVDQ